GIGALRETHVRAAGEAQQQSHAWKRARTQHVEGNQPGGWGLLIVTAFYSLRSTAVGSAPAARRAGIRHAASDTAPMNSATGTAVATSGGLTPIGRPWSSGTASSAAARPRTRPAAVKRRPSPRTRRIT